MIIINQDYWLDLPLSNFLKIFLALTLTPSQLQLPGNRDIVNKLLFRDLQERNWFAETNFRNKDVDCLENSMLETVQN